MSPEGIEFWNVVAPLKWPAPPPWMSLSTLRELEACPRRWALRMADYGRLWRGNGYPQFPHFAALEGIVAHETIDRIVKALSDHNCMSVRDARAVEILRELGGYSALIAQSIEAALARFDENPRAQPVLAAIRFRLLERVSELRSRVQRQVSRLTLVATFNEARARDPEGRSGKRRPLPMGTHVEVELCASGLGWRGFADLLVLSGSSCEMWDFKTGEPKDHHQLQLRVYSLLWVRDNDLNPHGRAVDSLVLSYDRQAMDLPVLSVDEMSSLENEIRVRTTTALASLKVLPPEAKPSHDNCASCSVRHLCNPYWQWLSEQRVDGGSASSSFGDVELQITGRHGSSSWDARVLNQRGGIRSVLLRTERPLRVGQRVRVLNVHISSAPEENTGQWHTSCVATMGAYSELYNMPAK